MTVPVNLLTEEELKQFFTTAKNNSDSFSRDNYLACALLVCLGVRKSELYEVKWEEFKLDDALWHLPKERSKTNVGFTIPLAPEVLIWLEELKVRGFGSEYVFPSRRASKRPHMGQIRLTELSQSYLVKSQVKRNSHPT